MNKLAKTDVPKGQSASAFTDLHPMLVACWLHPAQGLVPRLQQLMQERNAHAARTLVLLPFAQLRSVATEMWTRVAGDGFAPRFDTTLNWCKTWGQRQWGVTDIRMNRAWDLLTAQQLLEQAGLGEHQTSLAAMLVDTACQLAPLAAACAPALRPKWAEQAREAAVLGMSSSALQWEVAVARIAVEWAALSTYASDWLFEAAAQTGVDLLVVVQGFSADPLAAGLAADWGQRLAVLSLEQPLNLPQEQAQEQPPRSAPDSLHFHACQDAEDEAQQCTALALRHIAAGVYPVALVCSDRALARRVRALLEGAGVAMRDENGWKLSTSHMGAGVMALLQAAAPGASSDQVLNWLKHTPADFSAGCDGLESVLRREQLRLWRQVRTAGSVNHNAALADCVHRVEQVCAHLQGQHTLAEWLDALHSALQDCGMWKALQVDLAGIELTKSLGLFKGDAEVGLLLTQSLWSQRPMDLPDFTRWVSETLEAAHFRPAQPEHEQVTMVPMNQLLGRPFAAVLLVGCDEVRLSAAPEPSGPWSSAQRVALGLPSSKDLQAQLSAAWRNALCVPVCDVLWRSSDASGELLLPSPLVQLLQIEHPAAPAKSMQRPLRSIPGAPTQPPQAVGKLLPVHTLTQGAYEDLRHCPYRFFALRQLGLQSADELEGRIDKRDFGVWLHAVLQRFHTQLAEQPGTAMDQRQQMLDAAAEVETRRLDLPQGEFLPFAASWPAVRDGYLNWLGAYQTTEGAVFQYGEVDRQQRFGKLSIKGRLDRVDSLPDGSVVVLDYKTESLDKTRARIKNPLEDTQMAFYAALLEHDTLRGAYLHISEKETRLVEQTQLLLARDALLEGMTSDMQHLAEGAVLHPLGQGAVCDYCQARGLCRKDFWAQPVK
ncbi:MAG: PD-(D/E)XK nuclease family protein [Rhodoferax sp.]|nr:PD-(D/E)XK nuclease family protein [Rhodoferax sp.]